MSNDCIENFHENVVQKNPYKCGFVRNFDTAKLSKLSGKDAEIYELVILDIHNGKVFPAIRSGELHFYYKGGCLYKLVGSKLKRNKNYDNYSANIEGLSDNEKAKKQNENRYANADGSAKERQLLDRLNRHTFGGERTQTVVLDIEVRLNGSISGRKKCDIVLLNKETSQIMFVEGKIFSDKRVNVAVGFIPEVIAQVNNYTDAIEEQREVIIMQYGEHIKKINELFGTSYNSDISLIDTAKLLVYETPGKSPKKTVNTEYSIKMIEDGLGAKNVAWFKMGEDPTIDEIWQSLVGE